MNNVPWYFALLILTTVQLFTGTSGKSKLIDTVFLRFYGNTVREFVDAKLDATPLLISKMNKDKPTVVYIHGYLESAVTDSVITVVNAYLQRGDHNVLAADYRVISRMLYTTSADVVPELGLALARSLEKMVEAGLDPEKLHVVGHSLGGQVAAQVGNKANFQIPRITGLDPAGPFFYLLMEPLSAKSARFVDIIHTDAGVYGNFKVTGTVDFFPNGGHRVQPGCPLYPSATDAACSHHRSWRFYAESLIDEKAFIGLKCPSAVLFNTGLCKKNEQVTMGYATPSSAKGVFYLTTGATSPFGLHEKSVENKGIL